MTNDGKQTEKRSSEKIVNLWHNKEIFALFYYHQRLSTICAYAYAILFQICLLCLWQTQTKDILKQKENWFPIISTLKFPRTHNSSGLFIYFVHVFVNKWEVAKRKVEETQWDKQRRRKPKIIYAIIANGTLSETNFLYRKINCMEVFGWARKLWSSTVNSKQNASDSMAYVNVLGLLVYDS